MLTLASAVSTNGSQTAVTVPTHFRRQQPQRAVQAIISGTITVAVEGSMDGTNWVSLWSTASSGATLVALMPYMRVTTSGASGSPSATVYLDAEQA